MKSNPDLPEVFAGETREYTQGNNAVGLRHLKFKVGKFTEDMTFLPIEWLTGPDAGKTGTMHRGTIRQCPEVGA